ncbi:MAG: bifunctional [glutamate--ammonia ligase]-adenylyl-L-tyrosine phosphorylase/[glutamate--ammonia-ligase] adenylyltransferase [Candidatus Marinimicrobia bacterium]|nr:bifunctional [glutamate--ammonia ligase]-adenylyl-L-tyrosine phosphorylase/[glutamate--ammonia-ligase] adenylyltransferase [Candidatus Neomarinimicrobiota bacterium]
MTQGEWLKTAQQYPEGLRIWCESIINNKQAHALIHGVFGNSTYLTSLIFSHPAILRDFLEKGPQKCIELILDKLNKAYAKNSTAAMSELRQCKAHVALIIALADISGIWNLDDVTCALSDFADGCVAYALRTLLLQTHSQGVMNLANIEDPEGSCGYVVLALGKLGARELNYSSDIDLIIFFDEDHMPYKGKKSSQEFAVRLTKDLVRILHERTVDGYVFRTDLRLRPDPGSTAVAVSREAAQIYYESYGQNWERAALIKARPIAGDQKVAASLLKDLQPFIWRKSLDFYAIQDIQSIKRQMYAHKGGSKVEVAGHNIKLGRGGIREIEFFAQIQQLIWGGRFPETRTPRTLEALRVLASLKFISGETLKELTQAYHYLRKLEHRLQMVADEQTQTLPNDSKRLNDVALFMGYASLQIFMDETESILRNVERHYSALFEEAPTLAIDGNLVFTGTEDDPDTVTNLRRLGFRNPNIVIQTIRTWHHGRYRSTRSDRARQLLTEIMPGLLNSFSKTTQPDAALTRFDNCLASLTAGVPILSVFYANPQILDLFGEIMGDAPRLSEHLSHRPALLDYVLEPEFYQSIGSLDNLSKDLDATLETTETFEDMLDACRRWANDKHFRVSVQCLRVMIDPVVAAEYLTFIAEAVIINIVPRVRQEFVKQYGEVPAGAYAILGYGKIGSHELTPTSDLDLVAIYDADLDSYSAGGPRSLPISAYYIRLTQRIASAFTSLTREGRLYSLDMRLRPSGDKGPLASSLESFRKYQNDDAWTWEHMALCRARLVFGDQCIRRKIENIIRMVLSRSRNLEKLVCDVFDMRVRMRSKHENCGPWDIKRRPGGLIDGEFIFQFLLLKYPSTEWGNSRPTALAARLISAGAIKEVDASTLLNGINLWSRLQFMLRLTTNETIEEDEIPQGLKKRLAKALGVSDFSEVKRHMEETATAISALFYRIIESPVKNIKSSDSKNKNEQ